MLFTREQLEGLYYLMVGVLLLVGIPLFCERFHSGGDDGEEGEELWAEAGGSGATFGDGATGGSGSGSLYEDSLFLPPSNSSSSNTPGSTASGGAGSGGSTGNQAGGATGSGGSNGAGSGGSGGSNASGLNSSASTGQGSSSASSGSGGVAGAGSPGGVAGNQGGGSAGNQGGVAKTGSSVGSSNASQSAGSSQNNGSSRNTSSSGNSASSRNSGSGRAGGSQGRSYGQREVKVVEINRADSAELTTIRGIGPVYASKIIRYRERLGGFFDTRQLKELNLTYFDYDASAPYLRVDTTFIEKRHIEELTFKELLRHPYLEYEMVSLIFDYERENPGEPVTVEKLGEAGILRSALLKKLSPYFY